MNNLWEQMKISSGFEDYLLIKRLPLKLFLKAGTMFNFFPLFPTTFFLLQKKHDKKVPLPDIHRILKCPKCGSKVIPDNDSKDYMCSACSSVYTMQHGVLNMVYIPDDAKIADEGEWFLGKRKKVR